VPHQNAVGAVAAHFSRLQDDALTLSSGVAAAATGCDRSTVFDSEGIRSECGRKGPECRKAFFAVFNGIGLGESSVRSAMFIENEQRNTLQAPLGAAYLEFDAWPGLCWWRSSPCRS
jgi:hypothetical protein